MEQHEEARHRLSDRDKRLVCGEQVFLRIDSEILIHRTPSVSWDEWRYLCEYIHMLRGCEARILQAYKEGKLNGNK